MNSDEWFWIEMYTRDRVRLLGTPNSSKEIKEKKNAAI